MVEKSSDGDYELEDKTLATTWTHSIVRVAGNRWIHVASCRSLSVRRGRSSFSSIRLSNDDNVYCTFIRKYPKSVYGTIDLFGSFIKIFSCYNFFNIRYYFDPSLYKSVTQKNTKFVFLKGFPSDIFRRFIYRIGIWSLV